MTSSRLPKVLELPEYMAREQALRWPAGQNPAQQQAGPTAYDYLRDAVVSGTAIGQSQFAATNTTAGQVYNHFPDSVRLENARVSITDLRSPPFSMPLSVVYDIWQARMGDKWVQTQDLDKEEDVEFWRLALLRLFRAKLLEDVQLERSGQAAYRLKERTP